MKKLNKRFYKKFALVVSLCAILLWSILGAGTSLAWFTDTSEEIRNVFHFAEFDLEVSYRQPDGSYKEIEFDTAIFDDDALYEPGYVQVVYLKIENKGNVPFDFTTAVSVTDYTKATNIYGQTFVLQDYLRFGLLVDADESVLMQKLESREKANEVANTRLENYSTKAAELGAGETVYMALIVRMPESVKNEANYRGDTIPKVELGVIVRATQKTGS